MWFPYEMFMTSAFAIVASVWVATWTPLAIGRLVDVNRSIAIQSLTALLVGTSLRPHPGGLLVRPPQGVAPPRWAASAGDER